MKRKFIHDISVNSFQVIINQLCGLIIFYILSAFLGKNDFGAINWSLAVLLTCFNILSLGIDQLTVKKIASGNERSHILSLYFGHVLLTGSIFYGLLLLSQFFSHHFFQQQHLLLLLGVGKLMIFFSSPFKQLATGLEKFKALLYMSTCSNIVRSIALILVAFLSRFDLATVVIIFIAGDLVELLLSFFITRWVLQVPLLFNWDKKDYWALLQESLPQAGVAIFSSALSRFDWIFLGLFSSNIILAEYSFAYKVFEVTTLPLLAIAPVLIPRFTKAFTPTLADHPATGINDLFILLRIEMIIASLVGLVLFICWTPFIDLITHGKYGATNRPTILFLSACMPFIYFNNFLWTINFVQGRLKIIFYIIATTCVINIIADLLLIPFFNGEGASAGYLLAIIVQSILYLRKTDLAVLQKNWHSLLVCPACAITGGILAGFIFHHSLAILFFSLLFFFLTLIVSRQIKANDWHIFKRFTGV